MRVLTLLTPLMLNNFTTFRPLLIVDFVMAALCNMAGHYIFALWFLSFFLSFFLA